MRGGHNKKSIEEHILNGTYRPSLHGFVNESDEEALKEMKNDLRIDYIRIKNEIKKLDLSKDLERYEVLNDIRINFVKAFHNIAKMPVKDEPIKENDKDGFKTL